MGCTKTPSAVAVRRERSRDSGLGWELPQPSLRILLRPPGWITPRLLDHLLVLTRVLYSSMSSLVSGCKINDHPGSSWWKSSHDFLSPREKQTLREEGSHNAGVITRALARIPSETHRQQHTHTRGGTHKHTSADNKDPSESSLESSQH